MTTSTLPAASLSARPGPRRFAYELNCGVEPGGRRVDVSVVRRPGGDLVVRGTCSPPWPHGEVEVSAGASRRRAAFTADGRFAVDALPRACRRLSVILRGGGEPPLALMDLPVPNA